MTTKAYGTPIRCAFVETGDCKGLPQRQTADVYTNLGETVGTITVWACVVHDEALLHVARESGITVDEVASDD